jgi:hypothetical protein
MYRYRLVDHQSGADLGPFVSMRLTFTVGEKIGRMPDERFEVIKVVLPEAHEDFRAYLVVQPLTE